MEASMHVIRPKTGQISIEGGNCCILGLGCWPVKIKLGARWLYKIYKPPLRS